MTGALTGNVGMGASFSLSGTDRHGIVSLTTGSGVSPWLLGGVLLSFNGPEVFALGPSVILRPLNREAAAVDSQVSPGSNPPLTSFALWAHLADNTTYNWAYEVS